MRPLALLAILAIAILFNGCNAEGQKVQEIKFDLGKNIVETARASGVPRFQTDDIQGLISYSVNQISAELPARFTRTGYEVSVAPLWAFTLNADRRQGIGDTVDGATLQIKLIKSHDTAQAFVEQLLGQFANRM